MTVLLLGTLLAGAGAARGSEGCRMRGMHDCCKKALANSCAPEAVAARLCCFVKSQQPAPPNANFNFRFSPDATPLPRPPATQSQNVSTSATARDYTHLLQPSHSPPAYIQHHALLI